MDKPKSREVHRAWRLLGTLFVVGLITFALGEVSLRAILGIRPLSEARKIYVAHERWGWAYAPGAEDDFVKLGARQHIRINTLGHRDVERDVVKPAGRKRVLVLGDSDVAGLEVPVDKTWTQVAERHLRLAGHDVEVWNLGVRGWGTDQVLLCLQDLGMRYAPDVVLYLWNDNDIDDNQTIHRPFRVFGKAWFDIGRDGALVLNGVPVPTFPRVANIRVGPDGNAVQLRVPASVRMQMWTRDNLVTTTAFATALAHVVAAIPQLTTAVQARSSYGDFTDVSKGLDTSSRIFRVTLAMVAEMRRTAKAGGAELLLLPSGDAWPKALRKELGIPSLEEQAIYFARMPTGARVTVPFDSHWNELGHELYGRAVAEALDRSGLLAGPTKR